MRIIIFSLISSSRYAEFALICGNASAFPEPADLKGCADAPVWVLHRDRESGHYFRANPKEGSL
jgi:hypothetical protein